MLDTYELVAGRLNPRGFTFYTKFVKKRNIGFFLLKKETYLKYNGLHVKGKKGIINIVPLHEMEKHLVPRLFKPVSDMLSFLVYPHHSETGGGIKISADNKDFLFIPQIHSAKKSLSLETSGLLALFSILCSLVLGGLWLLFGVNPLIVLIGICIFYYIFSMFFKLDLVFSALNYKLMKFSDEEIKKLDDRKLPYYSVLIPLYKEKEVLNQLIAGIKKLDWPKNKLDVKLLLEADDKETVDAVKHHNLPPYFEIVVLPDSYPKTKPKALNVGLTKVKGEYLVLYDAEDMPESDQLKKAYLSFQRLPEKYACVQAKLNYYNKDQNWMTRLFTSEYASWFDLYLPGLLAKDYPIPLGGTSNHFKTAVLRKVGAWDPYNVTEDCDLGLRIYRRGYKTSVIDSTTWEEANSQMHNWVRQRSRWIKGYIQTALIHLRHPVRAFREFRLKNFVAFLFFIGGTPITPMLNLFFWILTVLWFATHALWIQALFPPAIFYPALFSLIVGNFLFVYLAMIGCVYRGFYDLVKWSLFSPIYWLMMALGGFKAFWQMLYIPHYWEKTKHGLHLKG